MKFDKSILSWLEDRILNLRPSDIRIWKFTETKVTEMLPIAT